MRRRFDGRAVHATIAFATGPGGYGIAYARVRRKNRSEILRAPFVCRGSADSDGRDAAYVATIAVLDRLAASGERGLALAIDDPRLVADLAERRTLPGALTLPYVRLRCALNRMHVSDVRPADPAAAADLAARARAESAFPTAA